MVFVLQAWEYAVLVTNSAYALDAFGQLYRDRADCENGFDELKNQWGWGGFTTQDIERCQTSARAVALVYNWWSWYASRSRQPTPYTTPACPVPRAWAWQRTDRP